MDKLPLEITEDILRIRVLPTASIALQLQCREVCKTWRDLVPKPNKGLLYGVSHHKATEFEAEFYFSEKHDNKVSIKVDEQLRCIGTLSLMPSSSYVFKSFVVGSCNGLVCYAGLIRHGCYVQIKIYICNPVTGEEHIQLPVSKWCANDSDPSIGFGYDPSSKVYKVVILCDNSNRKVQMCTLKQGGTVWRYMDCSSDKYNYMNVQPVTGVYVGGALYWIDQCRYTSIPKSVAAFDLKNEMFELLPLVPYVDHDANHVGLGLGLMVLGENLCIVEVVPSKHIKIWELNIWELKYEQNFKCPLIIRKVVKHTQDRRGCKPVWVMKIIIALEHYSWFKPCSLRKGDKCFLWHNAVLSCYDPAKPNTLRKLDETLKKFMGDSTASLYTTNQATPHVHSLVSPKAIMGEG